MNRYILYVTIFSAFLFTSCSKHSYFLKTNNADKYQVVKRGDSLVICYIPSTGKGWENINILINDNYVDATTREVFLSKNLQIDTTIINYNRVPYITTTHIHKISQQECLHKLGKKYLSKDIYVTKYTSKSLYNDDNSHLIAAYYYDKEYNILKIEIPCYNVYTASFQ